MFKKKKQLKKSTTMQANKNGHISTIMPIPSCDKTNSFLLKSCYESSTKKQLGHSSTHL